MFDRDAEALVREMEQGRREFDAWIENEMRYVRGCSDARKEQRQRHESEMANCQSQKEEIERQIQRAALEKKSKSENVRQLEEEQMRIKEEIAMIPKSIEYLEKLQFLLKTKAERLHNSNNDENSETNVRLRAFRALYGLTVERDGNTISFQFSSPEATVVIQEDTTHTFTIEKAPISVKRIQQSLMNDFNTDRNLLKLLTGIRSAL